MTYSFTQISQYLRCPRKYRYRYLDGWREKEDRASMIFGRCFENALASYFRDEDSTAAFFKEWQEHQDAALQYAKNDSWDRLYHQGIRLLERFAQDDRVPGFEKDEFTPVILEGHFPGLTPFGGRGQDLLFFFVEMEG